MKAPLFAVIAAAILLAAGCATSQEKNPPARNTQGVAPASANVGYDDRQIAAIQRGKTTEVQLLERFGVPESRDFRQDGRALIVWSLDAPKDSASVASGRLTVSLASDGTVEAYSARRQPPLERKTVEFVEKSPADMRKHMAQWAQEGWSVLSVSEPLAQADGTLHRRAKLSRSISGNASATSYDDQRIARIRRSQTTTAELVDWFGPPLSRDVEPDGRAHLAWSFASRTDGGPGRSGELRVSLGPDGKVEAYSARRGKE